MPDTVRAVKRAAVLAYGAEITSCDNTPEARAATLAEVVARTGATEIHPFDDDRVIAGAGTAALELMEEISDLDVVIAPVGGGGLLSGTALATHGCAPQTRVIAGEPVLADDAARSLATGERQPPLPPDDDGRRPADRALRSHVRDHPGARRRDHHRDRGRDPRGDADGLALHEATHRTVGGRRRRGHAQAPARRPKGRSHPARVATSTSSRCSQRSAERQADRRCATAVELRVALLGERGEALLEVVTLERSCLELVDLFARSLAKPLLLGDDVECALVALHRERRGRGDIACEMERVGECVSRDVLHEAEPECLLGVDHPAGQQEVTRRALADEHREPPDVRGG